MATTAQAQTSARVQAILDSMPIRDRVAQIVMPWIPGNYAAFDDSAFAVMQGWVDSLHVGGIIVSIGSPLDVAAKLNRLQLQSDVPLLMAADLEGGSSFRLIGGTPFPPNMGVAATGSERDAYEMGRITALEGRAVGIHLTFSPVADVNNNPLNPIINTRSFGEDPARVGRLVAATVRGLQDNGMLATAKHFPGHGDTGTDSHLALPIIRSGWGRLDSVELKPFRAAINAGVEMVMSAHIALPSMESDSERPSTLAPEILTGILRDSLGFKGIVVTDALNMAGVVNRYGQGESAVLAVLAGADLLLQPADPRVAIEAVTAAVSSGRLSIERLNRSVTAILSLKERLGLFRTRTVVLDKVQEVVGRSDFLTTARGIATRSVVLVSDSGGTVEGLRRGTHNLTLITYGDENAGSVGNQLANGLRALGNSVSLFRLWPASGKESLDSARTLVRKSGVTIFAASVRATASKGTVALPEQVAKLIDQTAEKRRTVLVSLGSPYIISQTPHVRAYLLGWGANSVTEWAVAQALGGASAITGRLPISLLPSYRIGSGLQRDIPLPGAGGRSARGGSKR